MRYRVVLRRPRAPRLPGWLRALTWVVVGGGFLAVVFVAAFFAAMRASQRSTGVVVPEWLGVPLEQARRQAEPSGLLIEVVGERNDPRVSSGRVIEQMPPPGVEVRRGRKVKLIVSLGGRLLEVPDLVGTAARASTIELRQQGFLPGDEAHVSSGEVATGRIIAQVPPARSESVPNGRVHRLVSDGPAPTVWVMPELEGRTRTQVESWIRSKGLRRGVVRKVPGSGRLPGTVVAQYPPSGYPIRSRDVVELAIAE